MLNFNVWDSWAEERLLPEGRCNVKWIILANHVDPRWNPNLIYDCHGVSVTDNYWFKTTGDMSWKDYNVRECEIDESLALTALHGSVYHKSPVTLTPEFTTRGSFAKAWLRRDNKLWLYKKGIHFDRESRVEVMVSKLLDKCNVRHVHYEMCDEPDRDSVEMSQCCRCPCITDDKHMIVTAHEYYLYCKSHGLNFEEECIRIDRNMYYKMDIVDYLIANDDRHTLNWGFFADGDTNEIQCIHPLFDHNLAFNRDCIANPDTPYKANPKLTMRQAAIAAMDKVDFHFTEEITRNDFISYEQYITFLQRSKELGIVTNDSEMYNWMRRNTSEKFKGVDDSKLKKHMYSSWLDYLRNEYDL